MSTDPTTPARPTEVPSAPPPSPTPPPQNQPATPTAQSVAGGGGARDGHPESGWVRPKWRFWHTLILLLVIVAIGGVGVTQRPQVSFLLTMALLTTFTTVAGHGVVGRWLGLLIDERNRMSLSRLQMILWTIVVLSGFLSAALWNVSQWKDPKIAVGIPKELWLVMGISVTSLAGSPLVLSTKTTISPADAALSPQAAKQATNQEERTKAELKRQGLPEGAIIVQGKVVFWRWPGDARPADLFQGDEIGNAAQLDLGKVQMLLFTLALVFAYAVMLAHEFARVAGTSEGIPGLPGLDQGMVTSLGISHAGYLTTKAVPHSR